MFQELCSGVIGGSWTARLATTEGAMLARSIPLTSRWIPSLNIFSTRLNPIATTFVRSGERLTRPIRHELSSSYSPTFYNHRHHTGKLERSQCRRLLTLAQRVYSVRSPDHSPPVYLGEIEASLFHDPRGNLVLLQQSQPLRCPTR